MLNFKINDSTVQKKKKIEIYVIQQDSDPKHIRKSATEWPKKKIIKLLQWPNQSQDSWLKGCGRGLKWVVQKQTLIDLNELKQGFNFASLAIHLHYFIMWSAIIKMDKEMKGWATSYWSNANE